MQTGQHKVYIVRPVLLVPGGVASESDVVAVRRGLQPIQAWFESVGVYLLLLDPKAPTCAEPWAFFADFPGGPFFGAQDLAEREGWRSPDGDEVKALVFLKGYPEGHGEAGLAVAVVGYTAVEELASAANDGVPTAGDRAAGLVSHEAGHLMGLGHDFTHARDLMSGWWTHFPAVGLGKLPERNYLRR